MCKGSGKNGNSYLGIFQRFCQQYGHAQNVIFLLKSETGLFRTYMCLIFKICIAVEKLMIHVKSTPGCHHAESRSKNDRSSYPRLANQTTNDQRDLK